jgi:hypothetical protein
MKAVVRNTYDIVVLRASRRTLLLTANWSGPS